MVETSATVQGLPELRQALAALPDKIKRQALAKALRQSGSVIKDEARRGAPVLDLTKRGNLSAVRRGVRKPGTLKNAIVVRVSKAAKRGGDVGVFINVRPANGTVYRAATASVGGAKGKARYVAKASQRGANSPNDPYYWRFQEFGTKHKSGKGFLQKAANKIGEALEVFVRVAGPLIEKAGNK